MAFSVVSMMDGSILGSLSASNCRSPGSNRAVGRKREEKKQGMGEAEYRLWFFL